MGVFLMATVNDQTFFQASKTLTEVVKQATGITKMAQPVNTSEFVTVAQVGLRAGYDALYGSISQVLAKTIFSTRPYSSKFRSLEVTKQMYGAITRKLQISDDAWDNDVGYELEDGKSVDMYKFKKPNILQTNFYGFNIFSKQAPSMTKNQLKHALRSPQEWLEFLSMISVNTNNQIVQAKEAMSRSTIANLIGGVYLSRPDSVIHLISDYNKQTGLALTPITVYEPDNFKAFMQWAMAYVATISELLTERTELHQTHVTGHVINRHTPKSKQRIYLNTAIKTQIGTMVAANTFNDSLLQLPGNESVNYWQSVTDPQTINVSPVYLQSDGTLTEGAATTIENVFGVIFDWEAAGIVLADEDVNRTPFNARGRYSNLFYNFTIRYWNDFTEKAVVLLMD